MSIEENTKAATSFLASLTLSRVGAGLAFASGCVVLYKYFANGEITHAVPVAIGVAAILLAVSAGVWDKLESANNAVISQWRTAAEDLKQQVQALTTEVTELHEQVRQATKEHTEIRAQLAACLERDRRTQSTVAELSRRVELSSGFGDLAP
jgi:septal ring factor EnvC (AmiA/AmiB activator)